MLIKTQQTDSNSTIYLLNNNIDTVHERNKGRYPIEQETDNEHGFSGFENRFQRAYKRVLYASGGVGVDSEYDFATPYLRQTLRFVGITDIEVIAADHQATRGDDALSAARVQIANLFQLVSPAANEQPAS